jgi:hypothetical protein
MSPVITPQQMEEIKHNLYGLYCSCKEGYTGEWNPTGEGADGFLAMQEQVLEVAKILGFEIEENTEITYQYRDADNYKQYESVIFYGSLTPDEIGRIMAKADHSAGNPAFIPSQVGMEDLQPRMTSFPSTSDHVWHELESIELTDNEPTIETTAKQVLAQFENVTEWDVDGACELLGLQ